jgi:4-hydroxy-tetrahydrodipicolinate reductase
MKRLVVIGARGRVGRRLVALAAELGFEVVAEVDQDGQDGSVLDAALAARADVVIDFSSIAQAPATLAFCTAHRLPLVFGPTGLGPEQRAAIAAAGERIPIVFSPNFSFGVQVLLQLVAEAARLLDASWDIEIVEAHHRKKVDAPSGTALELARHIAAARGTALEAIAKHGRDGHTGERPVGELGLHAVRGGTVVGDHAVSFFGGSEVITLEHRAQDRDIFAHGALRAAAWLVSTSRLPACYGMQDVIRG